MRRACRPWPAIALFMVCLAFGLSARPGSSGPASYPTRTVSTVEPLPPLSIELEFADRLAWAGGGAAVLQYATVAGSEIEDLIVSLELPEGLALRGVPHSSAGHGRLRAGERRLHRLPVAASRDGEFPVRLEAEVRLADGRTFHVGHGATLRFGPPPEEGRQRNGAYEVRGRTPGDLNR